MEFLKEVNVVAKDIIVKIGPIAKKIDEVSKEWINQQINGYRKDNKPVCVRVIIEGEGVKLNLSTASCPKASGGRPPRREEKEILDKWNKLTLSKEEYPTGKLIAFLNQID